MPVPLFLLTLTLAGAAQGSVPAAPEPLTIEHAIALQLSSPLFDRNSGAVVRALADERAAELEPDAVKRRLAAETTALFENARVLAERAAALDADLLVPAREVRDAARAVFRKGAGDVLTLLTLIVLPTLHEMIEQRVARRESADLELPDAHPAR